MLEQTSVLRRSTDILRAPKSCHGNRLSPFTAKYIISPHDSISVGVTEGGCGFQNNIESHPASRLPKMFFPKTYTCTPDYDENQAVLCPICTLQLDSQAELDGHLLKHIDLEKKTCYVCGKTLACRSSLVNHLKRHAGHRNFECPICQKTFVSKYQYDGHMAGHDPARKLACENCGKTFAFGSNLRRHERMCYMNKPCI